MARAICAAIGGLLMAVLVGGAAAPARVMILDGESGGAYHRWQVVTPALRKMLDETRLFDVAVVTAPPAGGDFGAFKPAVAQCRAVGLRRDTPDARGPAHR